MTASRAWGAPARCPMPWGRPGGTVSVSEREVDGLELAPVPAQPELPLGALIDLRSEPDGLALAPAPDAVAAPVRRALESCLQKTIERMGRHCSLGRK